MNPITAIVQRNLLNYVRSKGRDFRQSVYVNVYARDVFIFDEVFYEQRQRADELFDFRSDYYERFSNERK